MIKIMRLCLIILALIGSLLLANNTHAKERNSPPQAEPLKAELLPPETFYDIKATDPDNDVLIYEWKADIKCGTFTKTRDNKTTAYWSHPNGNPPACPHEQGKSHPGKITVFVDDGYYTVACEYDGSESGTGKECRVIKSNIYNPAPTASPPEKTNESTPPPGTNEPSPGFPVFTDEWLRLWGGSIDLLKQSVAISQIESNRIDEKNKVSEKVFEKLMKTQTKLNKEELRELVKKFQEVDKELNPDFRVFQQTDEKSARIKKPEGKEFKPLRTQEVIPDKSVVETTKPITIKTKTGYLQIKPLYDWEGNILEKGVVEFDGKTPVLKSGGMEFLEETKDSGSKPKVKTPNAELFIVQTHFALLYNGKENKTYVIVYEGKIDVKAIDGNKTTISPLEKEPVVLIITTSPSLFKIVLFVLVFLIFTAGIIYLLKTFWRKSVRRKKN